MKNRKEINRRSGFVLIMSVLVLTSLLVVGSYLVSASNSEYKIANAQFTATKNYYLAESGVNEMLWKIKNDTNTRNAFLAGTLSSSHDIDRSSVFGDTKSNYKVTAVSTATAEASIIATSTYQVGNSVSQRVVKSYVSKATGSGTSWPFSTFAGGRGSQQNGNFTFTGSGIVLTSNGSRLHANQVFKVQGAEVVVNDGAVTSSNTINIVAGGRLTLNDSYQDAPTTTVDTLQIDFDSDDPNSWKNRATATYTSAAFSSLPNNSTLTGIIYVNGNANVTGKNMTINGVLVSSGTISLTLAGQNFTVNKNDTYGGGLLGKNNVSITTAGGQITVNGLVYSGNNLNITSAGTNFTINGSMTGFDARITASGGSIILNYNLDNFQQVIDPVWNPESPLIQIDHWEEQY